MFTQGSGGAAITIDEVREWLSGGPHEQVAFLPANASPRQMAETLTAMANAHGGVVLVGVTARGAVKGVPDPQRAREQALAAALMIDPPLIVPLPALIEVDGCWLCAVTVPPGLPHVYSIKGQFLTRYGGHNRPLSAEELRHLLLDRGELGFEARPVPGATLDDLDLDAARNYIRRLDGLQDRSLDAALAVRGCLVAQPDGELVPTYAGILLFGRTPERFVHSAEIIAVRYAGEDMSDVFVREDVRGPLPEQIRRAEAFVAANMRRGMRLDGFVREERPEYPLPVVREAIVNAVAHRDYAIRGEGIRLLMFSDRLEVYSPGRLPGHVTLDNIVTERFSRNEIIVQVLSDMGYIERLGYGIDRMIRAMEQEGLPPPQFEETAAGFKVTLIGHGAKLISPTPETQPWGHLLLNPRQEKALAYLQEHGRITNSELRALCPDVSDETIRRDLADLVDKGLLLKIGEKRATYYILK
ncbi:MAG: ATP-binding protein [Anaerolineae bacterium]